MAAVIAWAILAGFQGITRAKASYNLLVEHMIEAEPSQSSDVSVLKQLVYLHQVLFELANEKRFRVELLDVKKIGSLEGDHFWIVAKESPSQDRLDSH